MEFKTNAKVLGAKMFKGEVDGSFYDSTTLFVEMGLDDSKGTAKGCSVQDYRFGTSEEFERMKHLTFPFIAELTISVVTSGKAMKQIVTGLAPLKAAEAKA